MKNLKKLEKSKLHRALEALDKRMVLPDEEKEHLLNIQKGFNGEVPFDVLAKKLLKIDALVLNDLMFTVKGSSFQVDKVIITGDTFHLIEVKNYEGNYQFDGRKFLTLSGKEITNPLTKFNETTRKMRELLNKWNVNLAFEPVLVFVNPAFTLYNAPPTIPIVYPTQIEAFFSRLNQRSSSLTNKTHSCAERLLQEHQDEAAFQRKLPEYNFESLTKGLWCVECDFPDLKITQRSCTCQSCGHKASVNETLLWHIEEFRLLFPDWKVTRNIVFEWCGGQISMWLIQKILNENYKRYGHARASHYQ